MGGSSSDEATRNINLDSWKSWKDWLVTHARKYATDGHPLWLHNPWGFTEVEDGPNMRALQFWDCKRNFRTRHLADLDEYLFAMDVAIRLGSPYVVTYIGNPNLVDGSQRPWFEKWVKKLTSVTWAIGFDATYRFHKGTPNDRFIRGLIDDGVKVFCESRPLHPETEGRPPVTWTERKSAYDQRTVDGGDGRRWTGSNLQEIGHDYWAANNEIQEEHAILVAGTEFEVGVTIDQIQNAGNLPIIHSFNLDQEAAL